MESEFGSPSLSTAVTGPISWVAPTAHRPPLPPTSDGTSSLAGRPTQSREAHMPILDNAVGLEQLRTLASQTTDPLYKDIVKMLGDTLSVGGVTDSTGVAVGRNIRQ